MHDYTFPDLNLSLQAMQRDPLQGIGLALGWTNGDKGRTPLLFLDDHTPHAYICGETGGGKTNLVDVIMQGLITLHDEHALHVVYIDYKGVSYWSNHRHPLSPPENDLFSIDWNASPAEKLRWVMDSASGRQRLFAKTFSSSFAAYSRRMPNTAPIKRCLLVIEESPAAPVADMELIQQILTAGQTLGIHILLTTQSHVDRNLLNYTQVRICTHMSAEDSERIIGNNAASKLPRPGWVVSNRSGVQITTRVPYIDPIHKG